jgi:hypothetical protein
MKISKIKLFILTILTIVIGVYLFVCFGLPKVLISSFFVKKYETLIEEKTGFTAKIQGLGLKVNSDFSINIDIDEVLSKTDKNIDVLKIEKLHYGSKPFSIKPKNVVIDNVYADFSLIQKYINESKNKKNKSKINLKYFPIIDIKRIFVKLDKTSTVEIVHLQSKKIGSTVVCKFLAQVKTPYSQLPIIVGQEGALYYSKDLYIDDLSIDFGKSRLTLSGEFANLNAFGKALPIEELQNAFVFFYRIKNSNKKNFIENFHNLSGTLDVNLNYSNKVLTGVCTAKNLKSNFFDYKIPISLPSTVFHFDKNKIWAKTTGTIAGEKAFTDIEITNLFTKDVYVKGNVKTKITPNLKKYYSLVSVSGKSDGVIKYNVKNHIVNVFYYLTLPKNIYIISPISAIDDTGRNERQVTLHTQKVNDDIFIKKYSYSEMYNKISHTFLYGDGRFKKINGHFKPIFLTLKTNGFIPEDVFPLKNKYIDNGTFRADLKYDFIKKDILGSLELKNSYHKNFLYINYALLQSLKDKIVMTSSGIFFNSPLDFKFEASNDFSNGIVIKNIDLHLDKFYPKRGDMTSVKSSYQDNSFGKNTKSINPSKIKIEKGKIKVNQIIHSKFNLHDVSIEGSLDNNIVDFVIPETEYAKGILAGKGQYDIKYHNSDIYFIASGIDSDEVATKMLKLPNQIQGIAAATLHLITKNKLNDIHANATFAVEDGFLPRLGSKEIIFNKPNKFKKVLFFINKPIKFTLSKISNIDFSKPNVFYSDLRGSFVLNNEQISDVKIYSQSDYLSLFIEGGYNMESELGDI